jgi:hypothetical protein
VSSAHLSVLTRGSITVTTEDEDPYDARVVNHPRTPSGTASRPQLQRTLLPPCGRDARFARYHDLGPDHYQSKINKQRRERDLIRQLEHLTGQKVTLTATA